MSPSETPGSSSAACTQFLRRCRWPSTCGKGLGTSHCPHTPILVGSPISGLAYGSLSFTTCRFARPPVGADQVFTQPTGTFTSGLSTDWSPAPPPDITTVATGKVPLTGFSPARTPTSIAAIPQRDFGTAMSNCVNRTLGWRPSSLGYCVGLPIPIPSLVFAGFDVVVGNYGEDYKNPHREGAHSGDGFRDQARQKHPSTAEN
jgi:hypothetical protein